MPPPWNPPPHPGPLRPPGRRGRSRRKNAMHVMYFTEQPMSAYPADIGLEAGHTALMFSNKYFDPVAGSRLYNEYLEHYIYAEEQGVEGFMLNEHHNAPFCMQAKCNIFASILAAVTKKSWELYDKVALETGYEAGPENRGYLQQVHVSDSEEKAEKNARQFLWMQGEFTGLAHPVWANPSGYFSPTLRRNFVEFAVGRAENPRGRRP